MPNNESKHQPETSPIGKLAGRVALITGSAQGIGFAIARGLAQAGAKVALFDINGEKVLQAAETLQKEGYLSFSGSVDISDITSIHSMIESIVRHYGFLDIVVNNAGVLTSTPVEDLTEEEWDRTLDVNLKGAFFTSQKAFPYLKKRTHPRIINISSLAGRMGGYEASMAYTASKGGLLSLTYGLSRKYAPFGITVNSICPGPTETPMILQWNKEQIDGLLSKIPIGKLCKPEHIAHAAVFLSCDESEVITGIALDINGGMHVG
jgi:NAD(P)-dependent dehydrogenase (short-subunit alcohol dehydrogenase family)